MKIQKLPSAPFRVSTGPVQFGDDWPGFFFRGDEVISLIAILSGAANSGLYFGRLADKISECLVVNPPNSESEISISNPGVQND